MSPALAGMLLVPLAACTSSRSTATALDGTGVVTVSSTDQECRLSTTRASSGALAFKVRNGGNAVTEFYLYAADGKRIVGEIENIGPGLTRDLVVKAGAGTYVTACKPGMKGEGIRGTFTVTGEESTPSAGGRDRALVDAANADYRRYVRDETARLLSGTRAFAAAYVAGQDDRARQLYPRVRTHWERIEPVAESFGDLDPRMDARAADLEPGQTWTGWHRIEKDLWPPARYQALSGSQRRETAELLVSDTVELHTRVQKLTFSEDQVANGAKELLDEVATGKVTGEEELWSHTDLFDFKANVDGAERAFTGLKPLLVEKDPALATQIQERFATLQKLLDTFRRGTDGFVPYDELSTAQVKHLSDTVNALAEPLSRLTAAVVAQ